MESCVPSSCFEFYFLSSKLYFICNSTSHVVLFWFENNFPRARTKTEARRNDESLASVNKAFLQPKLESAAFIQKHERISRKEPKEQLQRPGRASQKQTPTESATGRWNSGSCRLSSWRFWWSSWKFLWSTTAGSKRKRYRHVVQKSITRSSERRPQIGKQIDNSGVSDLSFLLAFRSEHLAAARKAWANSKNH